MSKILVVAVHPDDETLGCGGTLLKHRANGDSIFWLIVTSMASNSTGEGIDSEKRSNEIALVHDAYGFEKIIKFGIQTTRVDQVPMAELTKKFAEILSAIEPDTMYVPFYGDVHSDHRIVFDAVYSCSKTFRAPFLKKIIMMETISETECAVSVPGKTFVPNYFVDITDYFDEKLRIMNIFANEMGEHPFPRSDESIRALAIYRGAAANCRYAESFMLLKEIV